MAKKNISKEEQEKKSKEFMDFLIGNKTKRLKAFKKLVDKDDKARSAVFEFARTITTFTEDQAEELFQLTREMVIANSEVVDYCFCLFFKEEGLSDDLPPRLDHLKKLIDDSDSQD